MDRERLRDQMSEVLHEHGLSLDTVTWKEDLKKRELTLSLKIGGELDEQQELPLAVRG